MENNKPVPSSASPLEEQENISREHTEEAALQTEPRHPDEEHAHTNYRYAFKVLAVLLGIILLIIILKVTGVRFAIKDLFTNCVSLPGALLLPRLF